MYSGVRGYSVVAAPEDGHTPSTSLPPPLTHYPPEPVFRLQNTSGTVGSG